MLCRAVERPLGATYRAFVGCTWTSAMGQSLPMAESTIKRTGAHRYSPAALAPAEASLSPPPQKIDRPEYVVSHSRASVPANEFPFASSPGAHTQTAISPGSTATIPPPTPLFAGSPTR